MMPSYTREEYSIVEFKAEQFDKIEVDPTRSSKSANGMSWTKIVQVSDAPQGFQKSGVPGNRHT